MHIMQGDSIDDAEMVCLTTNFCYDALLRESVGILFKYFLSAATLILPNGETTVNSLSFPQRGVGES